MPEDPVAHHEVAALTRRTEGQFAEIQNTLRVHSLAIAGLDAKVDRLDLKMNELDGKLDSFIADQQSANARIIELLTSLVGRDPDAR